jgi:hypothetical protein
LPRLPVRWRLRRSRVRLLRVTLTGPAAEITLNEGGRKAIEVARWASRRGHRTQIAREDLLWGLLADASSESVRILLRGHVDLGRLWADLRRWHRQAVARSLQAGYDLVYVYAAHGLTTLQHFLSRRYNRTLHSYFKIWHRIPSWA